MLGKMALVCLASAEQPGYAHDSIEGNAFAECRKAFVELLVESPTSDASVRWSTNIKTLALSTAPIADVYLVRLGLFKLDGEAGSEYSCAASKRDKKFAALLTRQLKYFRTSNSCWAYVASRKLDKKTVCASEGEFSLLVRKFRGVPLPDSEGACSY